MCVPDIVSCTYAVQGQQYMPAVLDACCSTDRLSEAVLMAQGHAKGCDCAC
jgi:hypothetical protein